MGALYEGWMILAALIPSIGLLFLLWVILKHLIEGDRRERAAIRAWEAEQDSAKGSADVAEEQDRSSREEFSDNGRTGQENKGDAS